jgi:hypothetical protein
MGLMKQTIKILTMGKSGAYVHLINDKTFHADKDDMVEVDLTELLLGGDKNVYAYDIEMDAFLGKEQKLELYEIFSESTRFGLFDIINLLSVDKTVAKNILTTGFKHRVLKRVDTQWKLRQEKKEQIRQLIKRYEMELNKDVEPVNPFSDKVETTARVCKELGIGEPTKKKKK